MTDAEATALTEIVERKIKDWREEIFAALKAAEICQVGYVPDAGHARLIELCHDDPEIRAVPLTTEEEGERSSPAHGSAVSARLC